MATLVSDLRDAIVDGEIHPYFQPQIDLRSGRIVAVEALARWTHRDRGVVSPAVFIAAAEESGLVGELDRHMRDAAYRHLSAWRAAGSDITLSVNVSPLELSDPGFFDSVLQSLSDHRLLPPHVTIELTESVPLLDNEDTASFVERAREAGIGIAIDDFGIGFWEFHHVTDIHASELKLDRAVVHGGDAAALAQLVRRAHDIGVRVVAEGIETDLHLMIARESGCDRAQGYLLGVPQPPAEMTRELHG